MPAPSGIWSQHPAEPTVSSWLRSTGSSTWGSTSVTPGRRRLVFPRRSGLTFFDFMAQVVQSAAVGQPPGGPAVRLALRHGERSHRQRAEPGGEPAFHRQRAVRVEGPRRGTVRARLMKVRAGSRRQESTRSRGARGWWDRALPPASRQKHCRRAGSTRRCPPLRPRPVRRADRSEGGVRRWAWGLHDGGHGASGGP